jgi:hypothetical protein
MDKRPHLRITFEYKQMGPPLPPKHRPAQDPLKLVVALYLACKLIEALDSHVFALLNPDYLAPAFRPYFVGALYSAAAYAVFRLVKKVEAWLLSGPDQ